MNPAERVIAAFGGLTKTAKALGHANPSTVQGWRERGKIPMSQFQAILAKAQELNVKLELTDLMPFDVAQKGAPTLQLSRGSTASNVSSKKRSRGSRSLIAKTEAVR